MYSPSFTITQYILNYIIKYELAIEKIKCTQLPETYMLEVYEKLKAEEIDKLGELIGQPIGYSKALLVQRGRVLPTGKSKDRIFTNYRSLQDFINAYSSTSFYKPSIELLVHINKLLGKGFIEEWELGKLRVFSEKPNEIYDTWYSLRDFYPNIRPKLHFDDIFRWINEPKGANHKLIQFAVLLYELIDKAPFTALNQITSIITFTILAKEYGYNPNNIVPLTKAFNVISEDLIKAFKISKSKRDLTIFIETVLYAISLTATETYNYVKQTYDNRVRKYNKLNETLNPRQVKILEYLDKEKRVTRQQYAKIMGISFMTAFRDLLELLEKEYLEQKGVGRGTYYIIKRGPQERMPEKTKPVKVFSDI